MNSIVSRSSIVHLSDLHFGAGGDEATWGSISASILELNPTPRAVIVTGDLVVHPFMRQLKKARDALESLTRKLSDKSGVDIPYFVCPGNHDLLVSGLVGRGLWLRRRFGQVFGHRYVEAPKFEWLHLDGISVCLTGINTVGSSTHLATGSVTSAMVTQVTSAFDSADQEYCDQRFRKKNAEFQAYSLNLLLMHHNLLQSTESAVRPVHKVNVLRRIARSTWYAMEDLWDAMTYTSGAGATAELLSKEPIDLILHGHDHAGCVARYSRAETGTGGVQFIGAASSTGTISSPHRWVLKDSNFCVLSFSEIGGVLLRRYFFKDCKMVAGDDEIILGSKRLRKAMFYRARRGLSRELSDQPLGIQLDRSFVVEDNGDVIVRRVFSGMSVVDKSASVIAFSDRESSIEILEAAVDTAGGRVVCPHGGFQPTETAGRFRAEIDLGGLQAPVSRLDICYKFVKGVFMDRCELEAARERKVSEDKEVDFFTKLGMECMFVGIHAPPLSNTGSGQPLEQIVPRNATVCVCFSADYWRKLDRRGLAVYRRVRSEDWVVEEALTARLVHIPNGVICSIQYPLLGSSYGVAWLVP